jgi:hypothetical protein
MALGKNISTDFGIDAAYWNVGEERRGPPRGEQPRGDVRLRIAKPRDLPRLRRCLRARSAFPAPRSARK